VSPRFRIANTGIESARVEVRFKTGVTYTAEIVDSEALPATGEVDVEVLMVQREPWPAFAEVGRTHLLLELSGWAKTNELDHAAAELRERNGD
jgi:hypothetical protein